uniref:Uncharacterized protein n=1 Tax=Oryza meridionalis TaxID=40149 RepID=A0A0E0E7I2_9ORYZ
MAAARLASTVLAGRRRAASVINAAGPRYGGGGGVHVHPWAAFPSPTATTRHGVVITAGARFHLLPRAAFPSPTLPPKPRAFSSSGSLVRRDGGAPRGGSFLGWTKTVDLDLSRILTNMEMLKNERSKGSLATTSLFLMASVVTISFGVYFFGVFTRRVDVNGFLKGFIIDILDDHTISVKMHDYIDDLAGSAVESINPIKRFVHWLQEYKGVINYKMVENEYKNNFKGKIQERIRPILKSEFVMPAVARGPKSKPSH